MTTQAQHDAHVKAVTSSENVAHVTTQESIHRDEYDFHTIATMQNGDRFIVAYADPAYGHNSIYHTYPLGECPLIQGKGCWGSFSEYAQKQREAA